MLYRNTFNHFKIFLYIMKHRRLFLCIFLTFITIVTALRQRSESKRLTHGIINGEVHGNGSLPTANGNSYVLVELRLSRNDRPRSIARTKIELNNTTTTTNSFILPFTLKYPLAKMSPHNAYTLSARIRNGQNKLVYIGDLPVPVTERKEKEAKNLIIKVIETRKFVHIHRQNYFYCFQ